VGIDSQAKNQEPNCEIQWQESLSSPTTVQLPIPLDGTLTKAVLDCLSCRPEPQLSKGKAVLHKSTAKPGSFRLYTLSDSARDATYGETINGEFRVPSGGQLIIELSVSTDAVDVWGGGRFDGSTRGGSRIVESRTRWWTTPPTSGKYEFSVRTYRGTSPNLQVSFHWYRWDETACCIQHEVETIDVEVIELPCEPTGRDPAIPELRLAASNGDGHIEVRVPCCPNCSGAPVCAPGDTSAWFVAFPPSGASDVIVDGHARGWRFDGTTLWSPGTDRLGYQFELGQ